MKINKKTIAQLQESNGAKAMLAAKFDKSLSSVQLWINANALNGPLTTYTAVKTIAESFNIKLDVTASAILEEVK